MFEVKKNQRNVTVLPGCINKINQNDEVFNLFLIFFFYLFALIQNISQRKSLNSQNRNTKNYNSFCLLIFRRNLNWQAFSYSNVNVATNEIVRMLTVIHALPQNFFLFFLIFRLTHNPHTSLYYTLYTHVTIL